MTASRLKTILEYNNPESLFFSKSNMKFFGDTMSNYGVRDCGDTWELYRKQPVKYGLQDSHFFNKADLR